MSDSNESPAQSVFRSLWSDLESGSNRDENAAAMNTRRRGEERTDEGGNALDTERAWRNERYRLLSEIEHLRATLDRMRGRVDQAERLERQVQEVQCYNDELEARWKQHVEPSSPSGPNNPRSKESRIEELENQVVNLLDRSANGDREVQAVREKMEATLAVTKRALELEAERKLRASEAQWMRERRSLLNEIENLRKKLPVDRPRSLREQPSLLRRIFRC